MMILSTITDLQTGRKYRGAFDPTDRLGFGDTFKLHLLNGKYEFRIKNIRGWLGSTSGRITYIMDGTGKRFCLTL